MPFLLDREGWTEGDGLRPDLSHPAAWTSAREQRAVQAPEALVLKPVLHCFPARPMRESGLPGQRYGLQAKRRRPTAEGL